MIDNGTVAGIVLVMVFQVPCRNIRPLTQHPSVFFSSSHVVMYPGRVLLKISLLVGCPT